MTAQAAVADLPLLIEDDDDDDDGSSTQMGRDGSRIISVGMYGMYVSILY